jgi:hypothetical protein
MYLPFFLKAIGPAVHAATVWESRLLILFIFTTWLSPTLISIAF